VAAVQGRLRAWALLIVGAAVAMSPQARAQCYEVVETVQFSGPCGSSTWDVDIRDINDQGDVCGDRYCSPGSTRMPWIKRAGQPVTTYSLPSGSGDSWTMYISAEGWVVGETDYIGFPFTGNFGWIYRDGVATMIFPPENRPGSEKIFIRGISDDGTVVGWYLEDTNGEFGGSYYHAFYWKDYQMTLLDEVLGSAESGASAISRGGIIAGWLGPDYQDSQAFVLDGEVLAVMPPPEGYTAFEPLAINDLGQFVARAWSPGGLSTAPAYRVSGRELLPLGVLPPSQRFTPADIAVDGSVIVGIGSNPDVGGLVWTPGDLRRLRQRVAHMPANSFSWVRALDALGRVVSPAGNHDAAFVLAPARPPTEDLNGNCKIDWPDLIELLGHWGVEGAPGDFDGIGGPDAGDLEHMLMEWSWR